MVHCEQPGRERTEYFTRSRLSLVPSQHLEMTTAFPADRFRGPGDSPCWSDMPGVPAVIDLPRSLELTNAYLTRL